MTPTFDPLANIGGGHQVKQYVIYLAVREGKHSPFAQGIAKCKSAPVHDASIHTKCFQMDETRHITLWVGDMYVKDASKLKFSQSSTPKTAPIPVTFTGLTPWKAGVYLHVTPSVTAQLKNLINNHIFYGTLPADKMSCNHLSLYRKRNFRSHNSYAEMARIRKVVQNHDWGTLDGVSIRIKETGTEYSQCRVLWEAEE